MAALLTAPLVGSFLGVLVDRLPADRPVVMARSRCDGCGATLRWSELIPLASYTLQRGRCRRCGAGLPPFLPAIELAALAVAATAVLALPGLPAWVLAGSLGLGFTLLAAGWIDWRHFYLPDALVLPLIPAGLAMGAALDPALLPDLAWGAGLGGIGLWAVGAAYARLRGRAGLGLGDAKLMAAAGAWVGWQGLPSVLLLGALAGLALALAHRRAIPLAAGTAVPFGPGLALGLWATWLLGPLGGG